MPGYRGHLVGGAIAFVVACNVIKTFYTKMSWSPMEVIVGLTLCLLGALFPDIDIKSVGQRVFYSFALALSIFSILTNQHSLLAVLCVITLFPLVVSHRGVIHRLWFVVFVPLLVPLIVSYGNPSLFAPSFVLYIYFLFGAISHLILDYGFLRFFRR